jgi:hypothetical protein
MYNIWPYVIGHINYDVNVRMTYLYMKWMKFGIVLVVVLWVFDVQWDLFEANVTTLKAYRKCLEIGKS